MNDEHDIADTAIQHGGWIAAALVATWGWILKKAQSDTGRSLSEMKEGMIRLEEKFDVMVADVAHIKGHLGLNGYGKKDARD